MIPDELLKGGKLVFVKEPGVAVAMGAPRYDLKGGEWNLEHVSSRPEQRCVLPNHIEHFYGRGYRSSENPHWFVCKDCIA